MRQLRVIAALAGLAPILTGATALARAATGTPPPALTGRTTVVATHSATALVRLTADATLSARTQHNPDTSLSGRGRFVALSLSAERGLGDASTFDGVTVFRTPAWAGARVTTYGSAYPPVRCTPWPSAGLDLEDRCAEAPPAGIRLHRGVYRLTVITDGAPVRFTLRLHGLPGHATVRPASGLRTWEADLPQREGLGDRLVTFGAAESPVPPNASVLEFAAVDVPRDSTTWGDSSCVRQDSGGPPPAFAYAPPCAGGSAASGQWRLDAAGEQTGGFWVSAGSETSTSPGPVGLGGSFWSDRGVTFHHALGVWIDGPWLF